MKKQEIRITTLVGKGAVLDGAFSAPDSARIDGCVNGDVTVEGTLVLGTAAVINGNINAEATIIGGEVNGNVAAQRKVEITATARVIGDVNTESIVIDEHAIFQGSCNMNQEVPDHQNRRKAVYRKAAKNGKRSAAAAVAAALQEVRDEEEKEGLNMEAVEDQAVETVTSEE